MTNKQGNWKQAEKLLADVLCQFKIPAYRKNRANNYAISDTDVGIEGHDEFKLDSKYSKAAPFRHHGKIEIIKSKYCKTKEDIAILFTKNYREQYGYITIDVRFFAALLSYWLGAADKETLTRIYNKEDKKDV